MKRTELIEKLEEEFPGKGAKIAEFIGFAGAEVARKAARMVREMAASGDHVRRGELRRLADDLERVADELVK
jgi:N-acetylglucosamine kinase-like BadF-type ATPase